MTAALRPTGPRAAAAALAVAFALAPVATACGADEGATTTTSTTEDAGPSTTADAAVTAIGAALGRHLASATGTPFELSDVEASCVGAALVQSEGRDGAGVIGDATDQAGLDEEQVQAATAALDDCVAGTTLAGGLSVGFYEGLGIPGPSDQVESCVAEQLDTEVGTILYATLDAAAGAGTSTVVVATFDACVPADDVADLLAAQFEAAGAEPEVAKCVAGELKGEVSLTDLARIGGDDGNIPVDMQAVIDDARLACDAPG